MTAYTIILFLYFNTDVQIHIQVSMKTHLQGGADL